MPARAAAIRDRASARLACARPGCVPYASWRSSLLVPLLGPRGRKRARTPTLSINRGRVHQSSGVTPVELRFTVVDSGGRKRVRRWVRGPIFGRASSDPTRVRHQVRTVAASRRRPQGTAAPWSLSSGLMHARIGVSPGAPRRDRVVHPYRRVPPPPRLRSAAARDAVATPSKSERGTAILSQPFNARKDDLAGIGPDAGTRQTRGQQRDGEGSAAPPPTSRSRPACAPSMLSMPVLLVV